MDKSTIIDRLHLDDQNALKELYKVYYKALLYFVNQYVKDNFIAEDIVADTYVNIWENRSSFQSLESLRSFLYISEKNKALNYLRKSSTKNEVIDVNTLENEIWADSDVLNKIIKTELFKSIFEEVQKLPQKQQEIFRLTYIEDKSVEEICALLQLSESAVYTNRSRYSYTKKASPQ